MLLIFHIFSYFCQQWCKQEQTAPPPTHPSPKKSSSTLFIWIILHVFWTVSSPFGAEPFHRGSLICVSVGRQTVHAHLWAPLIGVSVRTRRKTPSLSSLCLLPRLSAFIISPIILSYVPISPLFPASLSSSLISPPIPCERGVTRLSGWNEQQQPVNGVCPDHFNSWLLLEQLRRGSTLHKVAGRLDPFIMTAGVQKSQQIK